MELPTPVKWWFGLKHVQPFALEWAESKTSATTNPLPRTPWIRRCFTGENWNLESCDCELSSTTRRCFWYGIWYVFLQMSSVAWQWEALHEKKKPVNWTNLYKSIIYLLIRGGCGGGALFWEPVLNRCFWIDHHLSFRVHFNDLKQESADQRINTIKSRNLPQLMVSEAIKHR